MVDYGRWERSVPVRESDGKATGTREAPDGLAGAVFDADAIILLQGIFAELKSINGALGDLLDSAGKQRTEIL